MVGIGNHNSFHLFVFHMLFYYLHLISDRYLLLERSLVIGVDLEDLFRAFFLVIKTSECIVDWALGHCRLGMRSHPL